MTPTFIGTAIFPINTGSCFVRLHLSRPFCCPSRHRRLVWRQQQQLPLPVSELWEALTVINILFYAIHILKRLGNVSMRKTYSLSATIMTSTYPWRGDGQNKNKVSKHFLITRSNASQQAIIEWVSRLLLVSSTEKEGWTKEIETKWSKLSERAKGSMSNVNQENTELWKEKSDSFWVLFC